jgi:hypothetical protein
VSDRERILSALPKGGGSSPVAPWVGLSARADAGSLWAQFESALASLGGRIAALTDLQSLQGKPCVLDEDAHSLLAGLEWTVTDVPWEAETGITLAECGVAETGSILLSAGPGRRRLASLTPPLHIALLPKDSLVGTLEEAFERLGPRTSVVVTGPSRTADIEGVLVRGVHGPGELWVIPIEGGLK